MKNLQPQIKGIITLDLAENKSQHSSAGSSPIHGFDANQEPVYRREDTRPVTRRFATSQRLSLFGQLPPVTRGSRPSTICKRTRSTSLPPVFDSDGEVDSLCSAKCSDKVYSSFNSLDWDPDALQGSYNSLEWDPSGTFSSPAKQTNSSTENDVTLVSEASEEDDFQDVNSSITVYCPGIEGSGEVSNMEQQIRIHRMAVGRAEMFVEDDVQLISPDKVTLDFLELKVTAAEDHKMKLQEAMLFLVEHDSEYYEERLKSLAKSAKKVIVEFIIKGQEYIRGYKDASKAQEKTVHSEKERIATTAAKIKVARVNEYQEKTVDAVQKLVDELRDVKMTIPESDTQYHNLYEKLVKFTKRSDQVQKDARSLCNDAIETGLEDPARLLEDAIQELKKAQDEADEKLSEYKEELGIMGSLGAQTKHMDIKPPSFTGDPDDKVDYYSFKKSWDEFISSRSFSKAERFRILQNTCLKGTSAYACIHMESEDEIWTHLKDNYGNPSILLAAKIEEIRKLGSCPFGYTKRREWAININSKLSYLHSLALRFELQEKLYHCNLVNEIRGSLPKDVHKDFKDELKKNVNEYGNVSNKVVFEKLMEFMGTFVIDSTFEINFELTATNTEQGRSVKPPNPVSKPFTSKKSFNSSTVQAGTQSQKKIKPQKRNINAHMGKPAMEKNCTFCSKNHTHLFYCEQFINCEFQDRYKMAGSVKVCFRCLRMDTEVDFNDRPGWWNTHKQDCRTEFPCSAGNCGKKPPFKQFHFTLCGWHEKKNKDLEPEFIKSLDSSKLPSSGARFFFLSSPIYQFVGTTEESAKKTTGYKILPDISEPGIFMLQTVAVEKDREILLFYDSGCQGAALSDRAYSLLETETMREGPTLLNVASGETIKIEHGDERFWLKLHGANTKATITGIRMKHLTCEFPAMSLQEAWDEVQTGYLNTNPKGSDLPKVDKSVGGCEVDLMLGIRYNVYFPSLVYLLPNGLGIYSAKIESASGCQGILGGPHKAWREASEASNHMGPRAYFTSELRAYCSQNEVLKSTLNFIEHKRENVEEEEYFTLEESTVETGCSYQHCIKHSTDHGWMIPADWELDTGPYNIREDGRRFLELETIGSEIEYRCVACRNCNKCRNGDALEKISLQEEIEQELIEQSVTLNVQQNKLEAKLPFIDDPQVQLKPNMGVAKKVLDSQMKLFERNPEMRMDTIKSHNKLLDKGHVSQISELSEDETTRMNLTLGEGYFIPWRIVYNPGSTSTPCRMVYDASSRTYGGESLNNILAKGQNKLARIFHILTRFRKKLKAVTGDVSMAYNGLKLVPEHFKYQKYLWIKDLLPVNPAIPMVIKTLIYGVRSSGGQTIAGFGVLSNYCIENHPEHAAGAQVLRDEAYMDDLLDSEDTLEECHKIAEDITFTLSLAKMGVKCFTFSGSPPSELVSMDGIHVGLLGYLWDPENDVIKLDIKELYLGKPKRGKLPEPVVGDVADALRGKFTRRTVVGKTAGVFDPLGLCTPITAKMKLDLHELCRLKLDWDDPIPESKLDLWVGNLQSIQDLGKVKFHRSIIPPDAMNTKVEIIVSVDASEHIAIAVVHSRVLLKDGSYFCQLVAAKSKLVSDLTIPKAELKGAVVGSILSHIVKQNLGDQFSRVLFVTDSTIVLFWINQDERPMQVGVRNSVIEIRRFSLPEQWYHIDSCDNIADLGTRSAGVEEVQEGSEWQSGKKWMREPINNMPIRSSKQVTMTGEEKRIAATELKAKDIAGHVMSNLITKVGERYSYSKYVVDPCVLSWPKSVRTLAWVRRFIDNTRNKRIQTERSTPVVTLSLQLEESEITAAENLFFKVGTREVKQFSKEKEWKNCSIFKDGILYYSGRILDNQEITALEGNMLDLEPLNFVKPILDRYSPIAYSIMVYCHQNVTHHLNAISTLRESRNHAYILRGRELANEVRESCVYCRRFKMKMLEVEMGKIHDTRLTIAPAFYNTQVDLMGPFTARCEHNHRSTVKVWGVVFKCPATSAVAVHAMQKYDTSAFLQAYTRFTSRYCHPSKLYIDEGGQLIKACKEMEFNWVDLANNLNSEYRVGIEYSTCPVGGHNAHGIVERSIKEIKKLFQVVYGGIKLDILSYETAFNWTANELNNLPVCLGSRYQNLEHTDLITPSRLIHGRNNRRAPSGFCRMDSPSRLLDQMKMVFDSWWEAWKTEKILDYIPQPSKWFASSYEPKPGDIVIFMKDEKDKVLGEPLWRTGRITSVVRSKDDKVRTIIIEYKNAKETVFRETRRSVRRVAVLHKEGDLELVEELNRASRQANISFLQIRLH